MAYHRKRFTRRRTGQWVPLTGETTLASALNVTEGIWGRETIHPIGYVGNGLLSVVALVPHIDDIDTQSRLDASINVVKGLEEAKGIFVQRIVGDIFVSRMQIAQNDVPCAMITAGIFAAPADSVNQGVPAGWHGSVIDSNASASDDTVWRQFSPQSVMTQNQPWMWRRSWIVQNGSSTAPDSLKLDAPLNNLGNGTLREGSNVDIKTKRFLPVGANLWLAIASRGWPAYQAGSITGNVMVTTDLRMYARITSSKRKPGFQP